MLGAGAVTAAGLAIWYFTRGNGLPCGPHGYGDIDDDGAVTGVDITWAHNIVLGYITDPDKIRRADVDGDGVVTVADEDLIRAYAMGQIFTFPVCK
ncbi:unnamed protein product [marine sediment metagenome]|uniref:Dockerin domain-containing protein n=1 Tax=marine sediment metagenome TaxID=412755 RepID=X0UID7_9ZZZZ